MARLVSKSLRAMALTALLAIPFAVPLAMPAAAQMPHINMMPDVKTKSPEEREREERTEKAYRDSMRKIPDAKAAADPWGDVRGNEAAKPAPKPKSATKSATQTPPKNAKAAN